MPLLPARPDGRCSRVDQAGAGGVPVPQADGGGPRHIGVHHQVGGLCEYPNCSQMFTLCVVRSGCLIITNICRHVASLKQRYTQSNGRRPFGISCLITGKLNFSSLSMVHSLLPCTGFDYDKTPRLYQTDPSGTYHEWKANAIGRNSKVGNGREMSWLIRAHDGERDLMKLFRRSESSSRRAMPRTR